MCARQAAERDYDLNRAAELKYGTLLQLQRQLKEAEEKLAEKVWPAACKAAAFHALVTHGFAMPSTRIACALLY